MTITFTVSAIFGMNTFASMQKEIDTLTKKVNEHREESTAKLNQLYGGLNFLAMQVQSLLNLEAMRTDPDFKQKMNQYNEGFKQNEEGEKNEEDAFNRNLPKPPTDETIQRILSGKEGN